MFRGSMKGIFASFVCSLLFAFPPRSEEIDCTLLEREFSAKAVATTPVEGVKRVLWHRLVFAGDPRQPQSETAVTAGLEGASAIMRRLSYGKVSLTWTITPILQLPQSASYYAALFPKLVADARAAATAAGFNHLEFDRDAFGPPPIAGVASGLAMLNDRWFYVALAQSGLIAHELGHTFGLPHASSWSNARPPLNPLASPPFPSNVSGTFPFENNSLVGKLGVLNGGAAVEYGDPLDIMGPAETAGDYNAAFKQRLGWLSEGQIANVRWNGTYRIHTAATTSPRADRQYALRIARPIIGRWSDRSPREYWAQLAESGVDKGLAIRWVDPTLTLPTLFVDAGARAYRRLGKALLPSGRAFRDEAAEISITTIAEGGEGEERWADVAVTLNRAEEPAPTIALSPSKVRVEANETVTITPTMTGATAAHWEVDRHPFAGGPMFSSGPGPLALSWSISGSYQVRCEVSDGRGNVAADNVVIEVGASQPARTTGRIVDATGRPLVGARVHNGLIDAAAFDRSDFYSTETDSNGEFSINGSFGGASLYGYRAVSDFVFEPLPRVWISAPKTLRQGATSVATIHRSGPVDQPLAVRWRSTVVPIDLSGTIPAGASSLTVDISAPVADSMTLQVLVPNRFVREGVTYCYPGWELANGKWRQTDPPYVAMENSTATIGLIDPAASPLEVDATREGLAVSGPAGWEVEIEFSKDLVEWRHHSTATLPAQVITSGSGFYRARRL